MQRFVVVVVVEASADEAKRSTWKKKTNCRLQAELYLRWIFQNTLSLSQRGGKKINNTEKTGEK